MKKIYTLVLVAVLPLLFLSTRADAQFPAPYCDVFFLDDVEPITKVTFAGIVNSSSATITNSGEGNDLEDFTAIMGNVQAGLAYQISVEGNTGGNYPNGIAAYFDWNHDDDFTDANEGYAVGALVNSTGADGKMVTNTLIVPEGATLGNTRMRIIKLYGAYASSCNTPAPDPQENYGQAEDYTIVVAAAPQCLPVYGIRVTSATHTSLAVAWNPVTGASSYEFAITGSATPPATGTMSNGTSGSVSSLVASTVYYVHVRANCGANGFSTNWNTISVKTLCEPATLPYLENFNATTPATPALPECISSRDVNRDGSTWATFNGNGSSIPTKAARYSFSAANEANDWLFTRGLNLVAGDIYTLAFKYKASEGPTYVEKLEVRFGTEAGAASMTSPVIFSDDEIDNTLTTPYLTGTVEFMVPTSGAYYLGFRAFSDADQAYLYVDDISIAKTGSLPVTITKFTGERQGSKNVLKWITESEQNNKGFELQRSADGTNFTSLGFTTSKASGGNSSSSLSYLYDDGKPFKGNSYYRLKQVDKDGKYKVSSVVMIKGLRATKLELGSLYPNPAKSVLNLVITSPANDRINLLVTDLAGKLVMQQARQMVSGDNLLQVNVSSLPAGSYMIKAVCANGCETAVSKFVKQ